ncbi:MAG: CcoQ/FixQ family Cbb3-type cytochrome c oxidase assembly chaperone [Rhodobacteraceae bacterium]|nr:CcoQ/FixQ family Cbb3-type cytochrome c oxidase assembly chaperone [Paracoccaceae bacterium]
METYTFLREFADSWFMLFMLLFFLGVILWVVFGKSKTYRDTAESIFRNEDAPAEKMHVDPSEKKSEAPDGR